MTSSTFFFSRCWKVAGVSQLPCFTIKKKEETEIYQCSLLISPTPYKQQGNSRRDKNLFSEDGEGEIG